jgi:hypothetical protein
MRTFTWVTFVLLVASVSCLTGAEEMNLDTGFRQPPDSAKPHTWWHWMDGNVSREGITKDLEAMRQIGIGGFQKFDIGGYFQKGPIDYMSPAWRDLVKFSISEADRLGLEVTLHNCAGWTSSGGPWITPEYAMKFTVWSETPVKGGQPIKIPLKQPMSRGGFYRDIAVFALHETPAQGNALMHLNPKITGSEPGFDGSRLLDGNWDTSYGGHQKYIQVEFDAPFTARSALFAFRNDVGSSASITLSVSSDGTVFKPIGTVYDTSLSRTAGSSNFGPVTGRFFRFIFENVNSDSISELFLSAGPVVDNFAARIGYSRVEETCPVMDNITPDGSFLSKHDIIEVTDRMDANGTIQWDAPAGDWMLVRMGYTITGAKNRPASTEATGLECDKFSRAAMKLHFENMMEKVIQDVGPLAGKTLKAGLIDSYEVKGQNWTQDMGKEFRRIAGYDIGPYLLTLTGRIVGSVEETDRFLYDYRRVIAELTNTNYFEYFKELCAEAGLKTYLEPYGNGNFETTTAEQYADIPMTEFWVTRPFKSQWIKPVVSAAHIYGKDIIGAESFTAHPGYTEPWSVYPGMIKARGDLVYSMGVNRLIFHTFTHQPWPDHVKPGMTMGQWGSHFDRNNTWWAMGSAWTEYLTRCQYLLKQGLYVADVAVYTGEDRPGYYNAPQLPADVSYDYINDDVLLNHAHGREGSLELDSGPQYRLLILPDDIRMSVKIAEKIETLVQQGLVVTGPRPQRTWRLNDSDSQLETITSRFWAKVKPNLSEALDAAGIESDFKSDSNPEDLCFIHRRIGKTDVYFLSNQSNRPILPDCKFRVTCKQPERWNPQTGSITELVMFTTEGQYTRMTVLLDPYASTFIVFRNPGSPAVKVVLKNGKPFSPKLTTTDTAIELEVMDNGIYTLELSNGRIHQIDINTLKAPYELDGSWDVHFDPHLRSPESIEFPILQSWTDNADENIKYYSGTATYKKSLWLDEAVSDGQRLYLDLGDVREMARVRLNGKQLGTLWLKPFRIDISDAIRAGLNQLEIDVVNLWPNRLIGDEQFADDRGKNRKVWPDWMDEYLQTGQRPSARRLTFTTWEHYSKDDPLIPSGLLGPVMIRSAAVRFVPIN